jgi:hypothetical protein
MVMPASVPTPVPAGAVAEVVGAESYERTQPQPTYAPPPGYAPEPYTRAHHSRHGHAPDSLLPAAAPVGPPTGPPSGPTQAPGRPSGQHGYPGEGPYAPPRVVPGGAATAAPPPAPPTQYVEAQPSYDGAYAEGAPAEGERPRGGWRQPAPDQPPYYTPVENWQWER